MKEAEAETREEILQKSRPAGFSQSPASQPPEWRHGDPPLHALNRSGQTQQRHSCLLSGKLAGARTPEPDEKPGSLIGEGAARLPLPQLFSACLPPPPF